MIQSITKPGAEIHSYQFTPSDVINASKAQLIIENGLGLELWFKKFTASAVNVPTITLSDGIKPLAIEEDKYKGCLLYTSPSPRDRTRSRMPSSA